MEKSNIPLEEKKETKSATLNDIKITISLSEYFNIIFFHHNSDNIVVSEERYLSLANQPGFTSLVHVYSYEVEGKKLYKLSRMTDYLANSKELENKRVKKEIIAEVAKSKYRIIEDWKQTTLKKLLGKKMDKKQAEDIISRCMNPQRDSETGKLTSSGERDKRFAEALEYPYREGVEVIESDNISEKEINEMKVRKQYDPRVIMIQPSLTLNEVVDFQI